MLGNYRITNVLNVGGMGSVYRAKHELLDRPAAIKLLRPELTENDELVQRFFNEAKAATAIRHPGIVEVYDFGYTDDGHAYLVMELLDGQPLSRAIADRGRFGELEAAQIARNIASALKGAHAKGIVHRDLKPDNVFLVPDPDGREARVKVLDFGIAKLASPVASTDRRRTLTGVLLGTPKYMAPEQAREAGTIDHRADLYSLGCILYELLVGEPPFLADGAGEIIAMQLFTEPAAPSQRIAVSAEMEALVLRLLAKEPGERPQTAHEVMDALVTIGARMSGAHHMVDEGVGPITPLPPARAARSRLPFVLAAIVLVIAGGTTAFVLSRDKPAKPPPPVVTAPPAPAPAPARAPEVKPAPVETKPEVEVAAKPELVVKKKPMVKASAKIDPKVETKPEIKVEQRVGPKTANDSPYEVDIGDGPRKPKTP